MSEYTSCPNCGNSDSGTKIYKCPNCHKILCKSCNKGRGTAIHNFCEPIHGGKAGFLKEIGMIETNSHKSSKSHNFEFTYTSFRHINESCLYSLIVLPFRLIGNFFKFIGNILIFCIKLPFIAIFGVITLLVYPLAIVLGIISFRHFWLYYHEPFKSMYKSTQKHYLSK